MSLAALTFALNCAAPTALPPEPQVRDDLKLVIGGGFTPDHLGPEWFAAVEARVAAAPAAYAEALLPPPELPSLAGTLPEALLVRTATGAPEASRAAAQRWIAAVDTAYDAADPDTQGRLADRVAGVSRAADLVHADILEQRPGLESFIATRVRVELVSRSASTCVGEAWEVWASRRTRIDASGRRLAPGERVEANLEVVGEGAVGAVRPVVRCEHTRGSSGPF